MKTKNISSRNTKILIVLGIFILFQTPWGDLNSFHYLLLCLFLFCLIMRMTNASVRKQKMKKLAELRAKEEAETTAIEESKE